MGTSKIVTWNMQGSSNFPIATQFLNIHKPAILLLQETKRTPDCQQTYYHKNYANFTTNPDVITMVRKDIKASLVSQEPLPFSCTIIRVQGESTSFHLANLYIRDSQLTHADLNTLFSKYDNLIAAGDFNAKHQSILPHTQRTQYNSNGKQLHIFLEGLDGQFSTPADVTLHNGTSPDEWTHITECGSHAQIDYIISSSNISHLLVDTTYEEDLLSDHQGLAVRAPILFPEAHTPSSSKFIIDWNTFDALNYKFITECELDAAVINGHWHERSLAGKIDTLTNIQKYALDTAAVYKQASTRGNTKPQSLVSLIKKKRKLQNGLRILASDTRIRTENSFAMLLQLDSPLQPTRYTEHQYKQWTDNQALHKKEIHHLGRKIIKQQLLLKQENWTKAITKLGEININTAPREFYSTMKKLGGMGKGSNHITKMEYNDLTASSEHNVADLMAIYVEDTFQPLNEPDFDYAHFDNIQQEWLNAQTALNRSAPILPQSAPPTHLDLNPFSITWPSPTLKDCLYEDESTLEDVPNPTKHQQKTYCIPNFKLYKNKKEPLPAAHKPDIPVNSDWNENLMHNSQPARYELAKVYEPFTLPELELVIKKMKRKAPGHDSLTIDCFKHLGPGGKHKLLDINNEMYSNGTFPDTWKHAIMVPILKKDKPAKHPSSYRPISLLPVGGKIAEALILSRFNPYIKARKLIPCVQTGFREGMSTSINLKRMYNKAYTRSVRATHPDPTIMVFFDAKKAFDSVWDIGVLHKAMNDGLPSIFVRFLKSWLTSRTLQVRIGQTLSKIIHLRSGVPQGSVFAPTIWNYYTGDIPPTISPHSDTAVYADDTSVAATHRSVTTVHAIAQAEIIQLNSWTKTRRIKFEPSKTHVLAIHRNPAIRRDIESLPLYLDAEKTQAISYTQSAKFLGVTFANTGTFHKHIRQTLNKCHGRIKMLKRFAGTVPAETLYKAYRTAIEPIALYGTEVLYENLSAKVLKSFNHLEFTAIKMAHQLPRDTSVIDCLPLLKEGGIAGRITSRRDNFITRNLTSTILRHGESTPYSQGRRLRVRTHHRDRSSKQQGWKSQLTLHQPHIFFSDINSEYTPNNPSQAISISRLTHPENHLHASQTLNLQPRTTTFATPIFTIKPEYSRMETFTPSTSVATSIRNRRKKQSRPPFQTRLLIIPSTSRVTNHEHLDGTSRNNLFDPG